MTSPGLVTVPPDGLAHPFIVTITAESDVEPASHTVTVEISRE